jgi:Fe-S-cluster containining protein
MPRKTSLPVAEPWFKDGLSFQCTQCGNCCTGGPGYVWMSDVEIDRLAAHFKISREETLKKYCRKIHGRISLKEKRDEHGEYPCIFLTETITKGANGRSVKKRGCSIYPVRPLQCRTWPYWDGNLANEESWQAVGHKCPGTNRGKHYSLEQILALRDAEDWPDVPQTPSSV